MSPLNIYTKLWHCIVPEKPAFLKTHKAEGSREKTHMYINITVSLLNVSLVCFPSFSISRFCTPTFKRIKKLTYLHFHPSLFEKFKIKKFNLIQFDQDTLYQMSLRRLARAP